MSQTYRIGLLTLRARRELVGPEGAIALGGRALDLLSTLAEAGGALVTKDDLFAAVWASSIVEENALQAQISAVRRALGEEAARLVTVYGRGYRLEIDHKNAIEASSQRHSLLLAVLQFANASPDADFAWFAEGVSDEICLAVSRITDLQTISRTSSFSLEGDRRSLINVRRELGATHVLDGSVRRQGEQVRIIAQLAESSSGEILWSERFEGSMADVFALQDRIAQSTAAALRRKLVGKRRSRLIDPQACDLYLKARQMGRQNAWSDEISAQMIDLCQQAIERDGNFGEAWSLLSLLCANAARWDERAAPYAELAQRAREAAGKAIELDQVSGRALVALSLLEPFGNYTAREAILDQAQLSDPNDPEVLRQSMLFHYSVGRLVEAAGFAGKAWTVDPLHPHSVTQYALTLFERGKVKEAYETFANARARWPDNWWFQFDPIMHAAFSANWVMADALMAQLTLDGPQIALAKYVVDTLRNPTPEKAQVAFASAKRDIERIGGVDPSNLVFLYYLGFGDEAFALIERSRYEYLFQPEGRHLDGVGFIPGVIFGPSNPKMRRDVRFPRLCAKLGLCRYWVETERWPDCADEVAGHYDFRAECRNLLASG